MSYELHYVHSPYTFGGMAPVFVRIRPVSVAPVAPLPPCFATFGPHEHGPRAGHVAPHDDALMCPSVSNTSIGTDSMRSCNGASSESDSEVEVILNLSAVAAKEKPETGLDCTEPQPSMQEMMCVHENCVHGQEESGSGRESPDGTVASSVNVLIGTPCSHTSKWKRLRAKKGSAQYLCSLCGTKWKKCKMSAL